MKNALYTLVAVAALSLAGLSTANAQGYGGHNHGHQHHNHGQQHHHHNNGGYNNGHHHHNHQQYYQRPYGYNYGYQQPSGIYLQGRNFGIGLGW